MTQLPTTSAPEDWHRHFARQNNNRAWDLSERDRTAEEDLEMLSAAHAAAWHWKAVGTELHHMRATMLLARVHALIGDAATALRYAQAMHRYFTDANETPAWELALAHGIYAHAQAAAGNTEEHARSYGAAMAVLEKLPLGEDRNLTWATLQRIPSPDRAAASAGNLTQG